MDPAEFAKRLALEKETSAATIAAIKAFISPPLHSLSAQQPMKAEVVYRPPPSNAVFDETDNFIIYPSMLGIKVVNLVTNKVGLCTRSPVYVGVWVRERVCVCTTVSVSSHCDYACFGRAGFSAPRSRRGYGAISRDRVVPRCPQDLLSVQLFNCTCTRLAHV